MKALAGLAMFQVTAQHFFQGRLQIRERNSGEDLPPDCLALADSAFSKMKRTHANTWVPKRKSKNHPLTAGDKETNRIISSFRVPVEHAIGGMKRCGVVSQRLRNRLGEFDDQAALLAAGIWNFFIA